MVFWINSIPNLFWDKTSHLIKCGPFLSKGINSGKWGSRIKIEKNAKEQPTVVNIALPSWSSWGVLVAGAVYTMQAFQSTAGLKGGGGEGLTLTQGHAGRAISTKLPCFGLVWKKIKPCQARLVHWTKRWPKFNQFCQVTDYFIRNGYRTIKEGLLIITCHFLTSVLGNWFW